MVKFVDIDPKDIDTTRMGRRGRVSYPILKAFMERTSKVSRLDCTGLSQNRTYLRSVLSAYIKSHNMPIKIFTADGEIHLMRLDLDVNSKPIPWSPDEDITEGAKGSERDEESVPLTAAEVKKRAKDEKGTTTK